MGSESRKTFLPLEPMSFTNESKSVIDFIADYYQHVENYPVRSMVEPGYLSARLPESAPSFPEPLQDILKDVNDCIIPGLTHWQSPNLRNNASKSKAVVDYKDWQVALSRRFRALKLWIVIRRYGTDNLIYHIRSDIDMAKRFKSFVSKDKRFEIIVARKFALVCFRLKPKVDVDFNKMLILFGLDFNTSTKSCVTNLFVLLVEYVFNSHNINC